MKRFLGGLLLAVAGMAAAQDQVKSISLRISGQELVLTPTASARLASLAREMMSVCGPNTVNHAGNFGRPAVANVESRWRETLAGSRLHVAFSAPFETRSHLGGHLLVSEVAIAFERGELFVGPEFTRHAGVTVEHLSCDYLPALELACLPEIAPGMPASYRATCARLKRRADGRIELPPPDIAPSCG
jgi:hypothetical protein